MRALLSDQGVAGPCGTTPLRLEVDCCYSALAVAPIMLVTPPLQLSLVFRFVFAFLFNPHHEVFGLAVVLGSIVSILGACTIAVDTHLLLNAFSIPEPIAGYLGRQL